MTKREQLLQIIAAKIVGLPATSVARVAVDGVDGAGKTTFADELAACLASCGRQIIRASVDGFHNPRAIRYRLGAGSPDPLAGSNRRYVEGQQLYLSQCRPTALASLVVNNDDLENPFTMPHPAKISGNNPHTRRNAQ
jgi:uridine kinase